MPQVVRLSRRAPRVVSTRWEQYWAATSATGDEGDVLWDSSSSDEARRYLDLLATHADPRLPVVDLGCGNGRFTRAFAKRYPGTLGVDLAPAAITRARQETEGPDDEPDAPFPRFRTADLTAVGVERRLREDLGGDAHVFIRGVLHVLDNDARRRLAATVRALVGASGTVLIAETNYQGSALKYLESLGATPQSMPKPLARAIASGLPTPRPFGVTELHGCFPSEQWEAVLIENGAEITVVPLHHREPTKRIPALVAVLRAKDFTVVPSPRTPGDQLPPRTAGLRRS